MTDEEIKIMKKLLKEAVQPIQGEISRLTTEMRQSNMRWLRTENQISDNNKETARLSSSLENLTDWLEESMGTGKLKPT